MEISNARTKFDADVANEMLVALKSNWSVSNDKVTVKVEDRWVTLETELQWRYQSDAAKIAISTHRKKREGIIQEREEDNGA